MLTLTPQDFEHFHEMLNHWVARDEDAGIHMWRSSGRRLTGRPPRYIVSRDDHRASFSLTAWTVEEALEKANKRLAKGVLSSV